MNYILLYIVFLLALFIIIYRVLKKFLKAILLISLIFLLLTSFLGYATYIDVKEFTNRFPTEQNTLLIQNNKEIITGLKFNINKGDMDNIQILTEQELKTSIKEQLKQSFKVISINQDLLKENLPETINLFEQAQIPKTQLINALNSNEPLDELDLKLLFKDQLKDLPLKGEETNNQIKQFIISQNLKIESDMNIDMKDKSHVKAFLIASTLPQLLQKDPTLILKEYKKGNINIHKETLMFKIIKSIPLQVAEKIPQNI